MPKGKRGKRDYVKEIADAIKRMQKYPEHLKSTKDSQTFLDFLDRIGVNPAILESESGMGFWDNVRKGIVEKVAEEKRIKEPPTMKQYSETKTTVKVRRDTGQVNYKSTITGKFVSLKSIKAGIVNPKKGE